MAFLDPLLLQTRPTFFAAIAGLGLGTMALASHGFASALCRTGQSAHSEATAFHTQSEIGDSSVHGRWAEPVRTI